MAGAIPVIEGNIVRLGFAEHCASVRASGVPVLKIDKGEPETLDRIAEEIMLAREADGTDAAVLGCASMAVLKSSLELRTNMALIDGVLGPTTTSGLFR